MTTVTPPTEVAPPPPPPPSSQEETEHISARWTNRRRIAWVSLIALLLLVQETIFLGIGLTESKLEALSSVINTAIFVLASLVGAYMGLATFAEAGFWQKPKK